MPITKYKLKLCEGITNEQKFPSLLYLLSFPSPIHFFSLSSSSSHPSTFPNVPLHSPFVFPRLTRQSSILFFSFVTVKVFHKRARALEARSFVVVLLFAVLTWRLGGWQAWNIIGRQICLFCLGFSVPPSSHYIDFGGWVAEEPSQHNWQVAGIGIHNCGLWLMAEEIEESQGKDLSILCWWWLWW